MSGLHRASGRWRLGLALAVVTAGFWATLPVALTIGLEVVDPWTLTWFRFMVAAVVTGAWLGWRGHLCRFAGLAPGHWRLLALAAGMLTVNYMLYLTGLARTTPAATQLLIQLGPLLLALGGILVFRESFTAGQWAGLALIAGGLVLFFWDQLTFRTSARYLAGMGLIVLAAATWAAYAMAQKQLLVRLPSVAVMGFIYAVAAVVLLPWARPATLIGLDAWHTAVLGYCALNTLAAYSAFAEALAHWHASRVGVVLAQTPLLTLGVMEIAAWSVPGLVTPERLTASGWTGAAVVVGGSMVVSLLARQRGASSAQQAAMSAAKASTTSGVVAHEHARRWPRSPMNP
jgi:drug/metabolite transporter (DMT)-like permease